MTERLVRDEVPDRRRERGQQPATRRVEGEQLQELLLERAHEGLVAYEQRDQIADLADVLAAVYALARREGVHPEAVEAARAERRERYGGFEEGIVLEEE